MLATSDFKTGVTGEIDKEVFTIIDFQHVKPGKGAAFVRTKLKNAKTGNVIEKTFRAGEKLPKAHIDRRTMQYLYYTGDDYMVMDTETFDQIGLTEAQIGDAKKFLKENMELSVAFYQGQPIGVEVPFFVELEVTETEPGIKGDTASGGSKPATLETGAVVQVPFFIYVGDVLRIDTRTGTYMERA